MARPSPITRLELRDNDIPRSAAIELIEDKLGRSITHESRYYLSDQPVHNGDTIEILDNDTQNWMSGRFEWSGIKTEPPTFHTLDGIRSLDLSPLARWATV